MEDLTRDDLGEYRSEEDPDYVAGKSSSSSSEDSEDDNKEGAGIGGRSSSEDESEIEVGETADDLDKA